LGALTKKEAQIGKRQREKKAKKDVPANGKKLDMGWKNQK